MADLVESRLLTFVEKTEKVSTTGKTYTSVKDDKGMFYSIWDASNAAMAVVGTPEWWSVETKGKYHNIIGRALAPDGTVGSTPNPAPPTTTVTPTPSISQTPKVQTGPLSPDIDLRKHALYLATLMYEKAPMNWDQFYTVADKLLFYLSVSAHAPAATAPAPAQAAPSAVDNDLVPEKYIAS